MPVSDGSGNPYYLPNISPTPGASYGGGGNSGGSLPAGYIPPYDTRQLTPGYSDYAGSLNTKFYNQPWFQNLLTGLGSYLAGKYLGGDTNAQTNLQQYSTAGFGSSGIQRFLPLALQAPFTEPYLTSGIAGIGQLLTTPGGLGSNVADAVRPQLANESQDIATNYRGIASNQAGALARGNAPISIKGALQSALDVSQERAQRQARNQAYTQSEGLRREDLGQVYKLLDALLQFTSSGRGQAVQGLGAASQVAQQNQASQMALIANALQSIGNNRRA